MSNKVLLNVSNLSSGYNSKKVIDGVSFTVSKNEIVGLIGTNGCGKTTLIKTLCRIIPGKGDISVNDINISDLSNKEYAKNVSLVPQRSGIGIDMPVLDVVLMGYNPRLSFLGRPSKKMIEKAKGVIALLGLEDKMYKNYMELSEGQKQLVIIARSLAADTQILLMDEPESALDFAVRYDMLQIIREKIDKEDKCALISLHDVNLAMKFCDKLLLLKDGKINSTVDIKNEDSSSIEKKLKSIYGDIKLVNMNNSLVMVKA